MIINRIELVAEILNDAVDHSLRALMKKCSGVSNGPRKVQIERQPRRDKNYANNIEYKHPGNGYPKFRHGALFVSILAQNEVRRGRTQSIIEHTQAQTNKQRPQSDGG